MGFSSSTSLPASRAAHADLGVQVVGHDDVDGIDAGIRRGGRGSRGRPARPGDRRAPRRRWRRSRTRWRPSETPGRPGDGGRVMSSPRAVPDEPEAQAGVRRPRRNRVGARRGRHAVTPADVSRTISPGMARWPGTRAHTHCTTGPAAGVSGAAAAQGASPASTRSGVAATTALSDHGIAPPGKPARPSHRTDAEREPR